MSLPWTPYSYPHSPSPSPKINKIWRPPLCSQGYCPELESRKKTWCMRACLLRRVNIELLYRPANFRIPISSTVDRIQDHPVLIGGQPLSPPAYCNASRTYPRSSLCLAVLYVMYVLISQLKPGTISNYM